LGRFEVQSDLVLRGAQAQRSLGNFKIRLEKTAERLVSGAGQLSNRLREHGPMLSLDRLDPKTGDAIVTSGAGVY